MDFIVVMSVKNAWNVLESTKNGAFKYFPIAIKICTILRNVMMSKLFVPMSFFIKLESSNFDCFRKNMSLLDLVTLVIK